jgi:hypothetical protein
MGVVERVLSARLIGLVASFALVGCAVAPEPALAPDEPTPAPTAPPSPVAPQATGSAAATTPSPRPAARDGLFQPFGDFVFGGVEPDVHDSFVESVESTIAGLGSLGDAVAAEAKQADGPGVTLIAFTLLPEPGYSEEGLLQRVVERFAEQLHTAPQPADPGEAILLQGSSTTAILSLWTAEPHPLFLFATGDRDAPVEEVMIHLLDVGPGG